MRAEKQLLLDEIFDHMDNSNGFIVTQYDKLSPEDSGALRGELDKGEATLEVVKKRIFLKALEKKGIALKEELSGHIGVVFPKEDPVQAAKTVSDFSGASEIKLMAAQVDGEVIGQEDVVRLSKLPGKDELRGQLVGLLQAPMQQVVSIMNSHLSGFLSCLEQKIDKEK